MRTFAAIAVLLLVAACQAPPAKMTEAEKAQIESEARAFMAEYERTWEALDLDAAIPMHLDSEDFAWAGSAMIMRGYDTFAELARQMYANTTSIDWTSLDMDVAVLTPDIVSVLDRGTVVSSNSDGVENPYVYQYVLGKRNGGWKILHASGGS
jgi:hypothetical protein